MQEAVNLETIKAMLDTMYQKMEESHNRLDSIEAETKLIKTTLIGNETYGHKGIVKEVADLKNYVEKDKMLKNKIAGGLAIVGIVWTFLLEYWKTILDK
jgi:hypothetical protein